MLVGIEVSPEVVDPCGQDSDLNRGASLVVFMELELLDDFLAIDGHPCRPPQESKLQGKPLLVCIRLTVSQKKYPNH